jgi:hypothetical protein
MTILVLLLFLMNASMSVAETGRRAAKNELLVIGTGKIVDGNVARARDMAMSEALVKGVEEYLTRRLGRQGMVNNFPRLLHDILPKAREKIENFHILAEEQMDSRYKILVRLKINDKVMEKSLSEIGLVLIEGPPIKVLFLVSQMKSQGEGIYYWWKDPENDSGLTPTDLALHRAFQERGLHPINRALSVHEGGYPFEMTVLDLSDEVAIRWGRLYSANVVLHGRCEIFAGEVLSVTLRALDVEKGAVITQDDEHAEIDEASGGETQVIVALDRAINRIVTRLSPEIISAFRAQEAKINQLEITLEGLSSFKQFRALRKFLKDDMPGVKSVTQTRVEANSISISVEFSGDGDRFLNRLLGHELLPFQAEVIRTGEGEVFLAIR